MFREEGAVGTADTRAVTSKCDGEHGRLRLTPAKIVSWDFAKLAR
jgi:hypothetical protein